MRVWLSVGVVLAVVAGAISLPLVASADAHADALTRYRATAAALPGEASRLGGAIAAFDAGHADLARLSGVIDTLRATPAGTLSPAQHAALDEAAAGIAPALSLTPGEQPTAPEAAATARSTTDELASAASTVRQQERREQGWLSTTTQATREVGLEETVAGALLGALVTGAAAEGDQPAIPSLGDASTAALALYPRAAQPAKDSVAAAVKAAQVAAAAGATVDAELLAYAARVTDAHASQDAVDAAAAAQQAAAAAAAAQAAAQAKRSAASSGSTAPHSTPVNTFGGFPMPVFRSHVPKVTAEDAYSPGCTGVPAETIQAGAHGLMIITLDYLTPYDYRTFVTDDGWGLTVIDCG